MDEEKKEQQAKEYFGEEFIKEYENLKQRLIKEQTMLRLHGTEKENAEKILKEGLTVNYPSVTYTSYPDSSYASMKNWKHRDYKYLVLIGVPIEATKYCNFEYDEKGEMIGEKEETKSSKPLLTAGIEHEGWKTTYELPAEFILGYIDVNEKKVIENPRYLSEHTYEDLYTIDSELGCRVCMEDEVYEEAFGWFEKIDQNISPSERKDGMDAIKNIQFENEKGKNEELSEEDWINGW